MSLISEALKKARQEAARQEALRRGVAPPPLPHHMPLRRRERPPWLAALAGGFLGAALLTAAALWLFTGERATVPSASPQDEPAGATAPAASPANAAPAPREETVPAAAQPEIPPAATDPAPPEPQAVSASAAPSRPASPAPEATPIPEPPAQREPAPRRAELADGTVLVLQGIAITDGRPVALVNGVALGPGERVEGFTVQSIDAMRIELRRGDEIVTLALR
jgi:hypothetical protein